MEEEEIEENEEGDQQPSVKPTFSLKRFAYIFLGVLILMMMINPELRFKLGRIIGIPLYAVIGFQGQYPVVTLMIAGTLMIGFSTVVRNYFMDWVEMAKSQKKSSAFQKELRKARMANKASKVKELEKIQPEVNKMTMKTTKTQIKSLVLTMGVVIIIFGWLYTFVDSLPNHSVSVPWALNADLSSSIIQGCFMPNPSWIGVYILLSIPMGQVLTNILKMIEFKKRLKEGEA